MTAHLVVAISAHGFGHLAQTAPVVNRLRTLRPDLRLTLRTALAPEILRRLVAEPWTHLRVDCDFGLAMTSGLDVDVAASARRYDRLHRDWSRRIEHEAQVLAGLQPSLLLANVPYLPLAAAARAGIPAVALCSLNWAEIYHHYCGAHPGAAAVLADMQTAYGSAAMFIQPEPSMPMTGLANRRPVGPIARLGRDRREALRTRLGVGPEMRIALLAPGGVPFTLATTHWPRHPRLHWIVPAGLRADRADMTALESLDLPFIDLLCSVDLLVGKPGYGTFVETACNGTPMLYVLRPDWPEQPWLVDWLQRHGRARAISRAQLESGTIADEVEVLLAQPPMSPVIPTGIAQAAELLADGWLDAPARC